MFHHTHVPKVGGAVSLFSDSSKRIMSGDPNGEMVWTSVVQVFLDRTVDVACVIALVKDESLCIVAPLCAEFVCLFPGVPLRGSFDAGERYH